MCATYLYAILRKSHVTRTNFTGLKSLRVSHHKLKKHFVLVTVLSVSNSEWIFKLLYGLVHRQTANMWSPNFW